MLMILSLLSHVVFLSLCHVSVSSCMYACVVVLVLCRDYVQCVILGLLTINDMNFGVNLTETKISH